MWYEITPVVGVISFLAFKEFCKITHKKRKCKRINYEERIKFEALSKLVS